MEALHTLEQKELLSLKEAALWAKGYLKKNVTESNISYLIQYGKIKKIQNNGITHVDKNELKRYYTSFYGRREINWKEKLGRDLNWHLSFDYLKESDTTKHVHRLHPYKGKFIPQLVEYFLDEHTDEFKKEVYFQKGDIILDPFCGSGTTLVQAAEMEIHAIGVDVSEFNAFISNSKIFSYDLMNLYQDIKKITSALKEFIFNSKWSQFEEHLLKDISAFNANYFPSPEFKFKVQQKEIDEAKYGEEKEKEFLQIFYKLAENYQIKPQQEKLEGFLDQWYSKSVRDEIEFVWGEIKNVKEEKNRIVLSLVLSRTARSCRATTHYDLATLKAPIFTTYYCFKHGKICKPLFSILKWWITYCDGTLQRLDQFRKLRTNAHQICLTGDSRKIDLLTEIKRKNSDLDKLILDRKIKGIFSSPPYVGLINYHEQHAYAYELFGFNRKDDLEIGPLSKGQTSEARRVYIQEISNVLNHCRRYLAPDCHVFLVANDKFNLYPSIAQKAGMRIVQQFKRPVLNRTERDKGAYAETIFHLKSE
jgi:DNA modification methylase